jgi:hypothetical protein
MLAEEGALRWQLPCFDVLASPLLPDALGLLDDPPPPAPPPPLALALPLPFFGGSTCHETPRTR